MSKDEHSNNYINHLRNMDREIMKSGVNNLIESLCDVGPEAGLTMSYDEFIILKALLHMFRDKNCEVSS